MCTLAPQITTIAEMRWEREPSFNRGIAFGIFLIDRPIKDADSWAIKPASESAKISFLRGR